MAAATAASGRLPALPAGRSQPFRDAAGQRRPLPAFHRLNHNVYRCYMPDHLASLRMATLSAAETETLLPELAELLHASVHAGASVSFVLPYSPDDALAFWRDKVLPGVAGAACCWWPPGRTAGWPARCSSIATPAQSTAPRRGAQAAGASGFPAPGHRAGLDGKGRGAGRGCRAQPDHAGHAHRRSRRALVCLAGVCDGGRHPGFSRDSHDAHRLDGTTIMYKQL